MSLELDSKYSHENIESKWYKIWEEKGVFSPDFGSGTARKAAAKAGSTSAKSGRAKDQESPAGDGQKSFCIVIPPPNITGQLHVGHALNETIQDVLTRAARKRAFRTLWLPGTDHAGIATQARVEKELKETENLTRFDLGRDKFIERVWEWKNHYGGKITSQMRTMGVSVDWSRERFTMDEGLSLAVRKVFVDLYQKKLIYRDTRMVNWDPVARTVLSDLEVEYEEGFKGELYSFAYPLSDGSGEIIVATTRPETILGDSAIAVHPDDERYKKLIGHTVKHPLLDRHIPIIGDSILVDPEFGTGAVKVTPAHDPNDFEVGRRQDLEFITIFDETAHVNNMGGSFKGMERFEARKAVKKALADLGLERGMQEHVMSIGRSQRSGAIVEPMISTQWFVKIHPLAEPAIAAVEQGKIRFVPKQWENLYFSWMREIRDWCISRQLWWGHQIPAWYCAKCGHTTVAMADPDTCESCGSGDIRQDPDVLDTWFSSALWPFSTLGWPEKSDDVARFYPNTVLVTAYDIIFFWVARMIMMGLHFMGDVPFRDVYIHGLMRDEKGRKISKSLGNNIDPAEVISAYGADAYRFFLMATLSEGKDSLYSEKRLKGYQNFANKIWNSTRFLLMNLPDGFRPDAAALKKAAFSGEKSLSLEAEDVWILHRLNETIQTMEKALDDYKFQIATETIYSFVWNNFCDWYIEFIKPRLYGKTGEDSALAARQTAFHVLSAMLDLLHPFMPFITEEIYSYLNHFRKESDERSEMIVTSPWPVILQLSDVHTQTAKSLELLQGAIQGARAIRAETGIAPDRKVKLILRTGNERLAAITKAKEVSILRLAQAESVEVKPSYSPGSFDAMEPFAEGEVYLPLEGILDIDKEIARLMQDKGKLEKQMEAIQKKLSNAGFLEKAPADVVEKEKEKIEEMSEKVTAIDAALKRFGR